MMELLQIPQEDCPAHLKDQIIAFMRTEWPQAFQDGEPVAWPGNPSTRPYSLIYVDDGVVICHLAVPRTTIFHEGETYEAFGISEVLTNPLYRRQGFGLKLIREAFSYTMSQNADVSLFTCHPDLVSFYSRGGWERADGLALIGGTRERPFRSDSLGLATMLHLASPRARSRRDAFRSGGVQLELGERMLW